MKAARELHQDLWADAPSALASPTQPRAKHTAGPLVVQPNCADGFNIGVEQPVKGLNCTTFIRLGGSVAHRSPISLAGRAPIEKEEALANGRLWAASPELLESVHDLLGIIHSVCPEYDEATMCANARAAIAKATGEAA